MFLLKEIRLENGMKRSELSRLTGIHQNTIANYENEERQAPYETLILFADFFGITVDELLGRKGVPDRAAAIPATAQEKRILKKFRALDETDRARIEGILAVFEKNEQ